MSSAKLLGLTISSNLTWNEHISDVIKKASKRLYFFSAVKKIKSSSAGYVQFLHCLYTLCCYVRGTRLFSCSPKYLKDELVRVEKRAMSIICSGLPYLEAIELVNIVPIVDFITGLYSCTFDTTIKVPEHRLNNLIPFSGGSRYALRCNKRFIAPKCKTNHFRSSIDNICTQIFNLFCLLFLYTLLYTFIFTVLSFLCAIQKFRVPKVAKDVFKFSFFPRSITEWNSLPAD